MTSVFIVRPFGKKSVTIKDKDGKDTSVEVDFNQIDCSLIQAALAKNDLNGRTTEAIAEAGNIRLDMFQMLIAYDLMIADISVDNANVFYELGIRHGLRPNGTILIRFTTGGKDVPFDLKTDRYIAYDRENPAAADPVKLIVVPREFQEAVEKAENDEANGRTTLALLGEEAKRNAWHVKGCGWSVERSAG